MRAIALLLLIPIAGCAAKSTTAVPDLFTQYKTPEIFQSNQPKPSLIDKLTGSGSSSTDTPGSIMVNSGVSSPATGK